MSLWVMLAVLGAAFLHALWNSLLKVGTSRMGAMVILSIGEIPIGLAVVLARPAPLDYDVGYLSYSLSALWRVAEPLAVFALPAAAGLPRTTAATQGQ